ncbi:hypothetical protein ADU90_10345 [Clostridium botulinum]|uniref:Uncharacterized protein n=1 Tax=Clostridium botulinum C/D str. DC5 TaxID=1443128 RepID=A0A0A0IF32_CLOBO|nr:hypothetical protein Z952_07525 [Clostridium botulinum C/D str. BKT75002]KEI10120.1 hypothetical protein Z954_10400 [Clostridium botulinum C/D str. BKT2873]KGM98347.1 hypothetical protein Z956_00155 [Clostridium botulinum D str. CCUG 7971]KGN00070.1 hypothetical protein Z955_04925 [Clostridium botulinum C/D str. DC5]KOC50901.1 hypothetical protein ADU88_01045 [Clostridium botulinum]OOV51772.1 hypothetical protein B1A66_07455 [Clostridium botulinum D/C]
MKRIPIYSFEYVGTLFSFICNLFIQATYLSLYTFMNSTGYIYVKFNYANFKLYIICRNFLEFNKMYTAKAFRKPIVFFILNKWSYLALTR